jgi:hypothetical protein
MCGRRKRAVPPPSTQHTPNTQRRSSSCSHHTPHTTGALDSLAVPRTARSPDPAAQVRFSCSAFARAAVCRSSGLGYHSPCLGATFLRARARACCKHHDADAYTRTAICATSWQIGHDRLDAMMVVEHSAHAHMLRTQPNTCLTQQGERSSLTFAVSETCNGRLNPSSTDCPHGAKMCVGRASMHTQHSPLPCAWAAVGNEHG